MGIAGTDQRAGVTINYNVERHRCEGTEAELRVARLLATKKLCVCPLTSVSFLVEFLAPRTNSATCAELTSYLRKESALPLPSPEIRISIPTASQHASMNDPP